MEDQLGVRGTELFDEVDARLSEIKRLFTQFADGPSAPDDDSKKSPFGRLELARIILWGRALLEREVAQDLFADPAFNILLTLYVSRADGKDVSTSAACTASGVPTTTALRWINALARRGMIHKRSLATDRRFTYLELSEKTGTALDRYFDLILDRATHPTAP
ncbi:transcriptional regulator [Sphingomonas pituitosa]|uniref:transcriptional regulator n=1 Tax=Sphingomonas pituitosa TaxID=99597 RepID=UPI00082CFB28|nr:transcriptional regulator [Sphingomonas pituitosa]